MKPLICKTHSHYRKGFNCQLIVNGYLILATWSTAKFEGVPSNITYIAECLLQYLRATPHWGVATPSIKIYDKATYWLPEPSLIIQVLYCLTGHALGKGHFRQLHEELLPFWCNSISALHFPRLGNSWLLAWPRRRGSQNLTLWVGFCGRLTAWRKLASLLYTITTIPFAD